MSALLIVAWLLPFAGAIAMWSFGPELKRTAGILGSAVVFTSLVLVLVAFGAATHGGVAAPLVTWVPGFALGLELDPLSLLWSLVITGVGGLIHVYSLGYMWNDRATARFFAYLNFFVFAMLTLVLSDNLIGLLIGWGLVGLASYFLIGFWFDRESAVEAARKAFVINVFGDVGIMFAIFVLFRGVGSLTYADIFARINTLDATTILLATIGIFIGCAAKSAQVPLHTWLPDAMEGPTPVSALIHAATMVTAGVYLIARFAPLFSASPVSQEFVGTIGGITMVLGAVLGVAQWDIKRVLAYSTMSQIGYMIMGVGVGAYASGVLHFLTHAFFKALLFLTAGLIIHELHDEQDIRKMGSLRTQMPFAFWAMLVGTLAIIGFPGLSGYYSKDAIIYATLALGHPWLWAAGAITAGLTAYYMFRLMFVTFFGPDRSRCADAELGILPDRRAHRDENITDNHAPDWLTRGPVAILMVFAIVAGWIAIGGTTSPWQRFVGDSFGGASRAAEGATLLNETLSTIIVLVLVALGIVVAFLRYGTAAAQVNSIARIRAETLGRWPVLSHAFYVDDALQWLFVKPARAIGGFCSRIVDPHVIDAGVTDVVWGAGILGYVARSLQNGLVRSYALTLVVGTACFIAYFAFVGVAK